MARPIVDLHSHWFSPGAVALLSGRTTEPRFTLGPEGLTLGFRGRPFPLGPQWFDIDLRLEHLARNGVVHQLLSWPTTLGVEPALGPDEAKALWTVYNDELSGLVKRRPDRFSAVAAVSTADVAWSVRELKRAHDDLGLVGVVLPVNALASRQSAEALRPLFAAAQSRRSHIYLHTGYGSGLLPGQPVKAEHADTVALRDAAETMHHFAQATITLAYTDFLDEFPDVTVQIAMLGGSGLAALVHEQVGQTAERFGLEGRTGAFDRIYLDTGAAGQGPAAITAAVALVGADRIVFGSDYAPAPDVAAVVANVGAAAIAPEALQRVLFDNGAALLARLGVTVNAAEAAE
jgi:predicted TIM-barrel fold metal-dependent hydrolase